MKRLKIIADLGSNFKETQQLFDAVYCAKDVGATAIKFQNFSEKDLYGLPDSSDKPNFDWDLIPKLADRAKECDIEFMCTIFNAEKVKPLSPYVKTFKVASSDMRYTDLLQEINKTNKKVILSTGSHSEEEIHGSLRLLGNVPLVYLLYCVSTYPANSIYLPLINYMRNTFKLPIGLSDHSNDIFTIPWCAVRIYGASILEKHFNPFEVDSLDAQTSLTLIDFKEMVQNLNGNYNTVLGANQKEIQMWYRYNRRPIAIININQGDILQKDINYGLYRSKSGYEMEYLLEFEEGKKASINYKIGDQI